MIDKEQIAKTTSYVSGLIYGREPAELSPHRFHYALSKAIMHSIDPVWKRSREAHANQRRAFYFSAEFLLGRLIFNNLLCLGANESEILEYASSLEDIKDAALGNGGLGRLAACFLDSAATLNLPLDGYGIRYKYGIFEQKIVDGFQKEVADDWTRFGDPWSIRKEDESVTVCFKNQTVHAVPYDMPIIGYGGEHISTLRLWQAESSEQFDFTAFNDGKYDRARRERDRADDISAVLYPNDSTNDGKKLRFKQQYFFCSASLQDIISKYKEKHGSLDGFADMITIQLNDTHPVISIPELIRLLWDNEGFSFEEALDTARKVFNYTNHTVMQEALEKWELGLISGLVPRIAAIIKIIDRQLEADLLKITDRERVSRLAIIQDKTVHMANMAVYLSSYTNGVAEIHTEILKNTVLSDWYSVFPERFQNKTNGITQRRWLALCNPSLSKFVTELLGSDGWITDLGKLREPEKYVNDASVLDRLNEIKQENHLRLANYIEKHDGIKVDPNTIFDIQIKRLHEYKRQLLNILTIMELYFEIKEGSLTGFNPTTFIFGAKAAPGYYRAKAIIKLINAAAEFISEDPQVSPLIKVVFVSDYNVTYAEKLVAAADVSEQISTAGTEASGTGNMKLMLNGAVTLGTYDGANIEIVKEAGENNNYIFGATVEEIEKAAPGYNPTEIYKFNTRIARALDTLIDGTLDDGGSGMFKDLYNSLVAEGDRYFLLMDFESYLNKRIELNRDFSDRRMMAKKALYNIAGAGKFSSDRTISEYAKDIWHIENIELPN